MKTTFSKEYILENRAAAAAYADEFKEHVRVFIFETILNIK